jgi:phospholipase C
MLAARDSSPNEKEKELKRFSLTAKWLTCTVSSLLVLSGTSVSLKGADTTTPIQHLVVIFQENVSFDHYFGTYPVALNPPGQPAFHAKAGTPTVNGLNEFLLLHNPNAANPTRLDRVLFQLVTCDQDHDYDDEQKAFNHGLMNKFVETVAGSNCADKSLVMDYYDGNVVTALWNYAQRYAMSDNSFSTTFGPSTPGALNLISGQTNGAMPTDISGNVSNGSVIGDPRPLASLDDCTIASAQKISMAGINVGNLLNNRGITWGWFQGGFRPSSTSGGRAVCATAHGNIAGAMVTDYIPHHEPFQYYGLTANPHHLPPSAVAKIGYTDQANHQYDLSDLYAALAAGNLPAVSYVKAAAYQDGHAGYSNPLDEQTFLVNTINTIMRSKFWKSTAIVILYDDSDGWYDHVMGPIVNQSSDPAYDFLTGVGTCGDGGASPLPNRCGYGPRQPFLVISPFAKQNFVDHTITDQSSVLRFIEDNWKLGRIGNHSTDEFAGSMLQMFDFLNNDREGGSRLILDASTGQPVSRAAEEGNGQ